MRGGARYKKRQPAPDPTHGSVMIAKFTNHLMEGGKKELARRIVDTALADLERETKTSAAEAFETAIKNVSPLLEVRSRRIGGATYQVPMEVKPDRRVTLAMRWIIGAARGRQGKPMARRLAVELIDAYNGTGASMKKREDLHKMAEANRAFAHFTRFYVT